ncbi:MAG: tetratricopeptide repeat protein [Planctomycetota bacterium]|nr:tetratricopeptide repeat protein [Planctomycetota bacterium]
MAESSPNKSSSAAAGNSGGEGGGAPSEAMGGGSERGSHGPSWSQVWQLPVLILAVALLFAGLAMLFMTPRPKSDFPAAMDEVAQYLLASNFEKARERINAIGERIALASPADKARLKMLEGDMVYLEQASRDGNAPENNKRVLAAYEEARAGGQAMDATHLQHWAHTLVASGREADALKLLDDYKGQSVELRSQIIRRIIERQREVGGQRQQMVTMLAQFMEEIKAEPSPMKRRDQQVWAVGMQAQLLMEEDQPAKAVDYLQRQMITLLDQGSDSDLGPLMTVLAKAFARDGQNVKAQRWYQNAQQKIKRDDPLNAEILVGLGQIDLAESDDFRSALEKFSVAESQYAPSVTPAHFEALVGRAYCESHLGSHVEAIEHFDRAVHLLLAEAHPTLERKENLVNAIRAHYDLNFDKGDFDLALGYLSLLPPIYKQEKELPLKLLTDLAQTHEKIAVKRLAEAGSLPQAPPGGAASATVASAGTPASQPAGKGKTDAKGDGKHDAKADAKGESKHDAKTEAKTEAKAEAKPAPRIEQPRQLAFQRAALNFGQAADYYLRHAHAIAASDDSAFGLSLWKSAECYDRAQDWRKSITAYAEFVRTRPNDPRRLLAVHRLGLAYQADGQYAAAIDLFRALRADHPRDKETIDGLVPLAQCYLAINNTDDAKRTLLSVLTDNPDLTPEYQAYRQALIELGKLHYQKEEFEPAIERLTEAVDRYGDSIEGPVLRFRLADAHRRSIKTLDQSLAEPANQARRQALLTERTRRLEKAQELFSEVVAELESRPPSGRSPLEDLFLRNSFFYRADCAYDLRRYEQSIQLYDLAAKRWEDHPASLVALVQIVNAYCEMGMVSEAKVATKRARSMLKRIPEDAFNDPSLPMTREHWEDWLKWTSELGLFGPAQAAAGKR